MNRLQRCFVATLACLFLPASIVNAANEQKTVQKEKPSVCLDETVGALSSVIEINLAKLLAERVQDAQNSGAFARALQKRRKDLAFHAEAPVRLSLSRASQAYRSEVQLIDDAAWEKLTEEQRSVLVSLKRTYLFFNGEDAIQVRWVQKKLKEQSGLARAARPIVTAGKVSDAVSALKTRVWADQGGVLSRRFDLVALPSRVDVVGRTAFVSVPNLQNTELPDIVKKEPLP